MLPQVRAGRMLFHEMMKGGNFGHQYGRNNHSIYANFIEQIFYNLRYVIEFPSEPLARPLTLLWDYFKKKVNLVL